MSASVHARLFSPASLPVTTAGRPCQAFQPSVAAGDDCGSSMPVKTAGRPVAFVEASAVCSDDVAVPNIAGGAMLDEKPPVTLPGG